MNRYDKKYAECPACHSEMINRYHADLNKNTIFKCQACKVQFMNPVYSDEYLDEYYSAYTVLNEDKETEMTDRQAFVINDNFKAIENTIKNTGEMLDFGIGNGTHSEIARNKGWNVRGYDVDCISTNTLMEKSGIEVKCGDFFDIDWGKKKFDLIYINQVMEHIKDPINYINRFYEILNAKGNLFITVPNIHATTTRIKYFLEKIKLRRHKIGKYYDSDHHIFYFNPDSLKNILENNGFEVLYTRNCVKPKVDRSKLWLFISNNILEKLYSTSTFMMIVRKI